MSSRESQSQSIKARKHELFEEPQPEASSEALRSFADYLRDTPPTTLSTTEKAILGTVGALVVLLFLAAVLTIGSRRHGPPPPTKTDTAGAQR